MEERTRQRTKDNEKGSCKTKKVRITKKWKKEATSFKVVVLEKMENEDRGKKDKDRT